VTALQIGSAMRDGRQANDAPQTMIEAHARRYLPLPPPLLFLMLMAALPLMALLPRAPTHG